MQPQQHTQHQQLQQHTQHQQLQQHTQHQQTQQQPLQQLTQYYTQQILNVLLNDHQHWHLGNTLTYTPFKNIEIVKILLQCSVEDLLSQFLNGQLTKDLIARVNPAFLDFLSLYKNFNSNQNLPKLINYHNHA